MIKRIKDHLKDNSGDLYFQMMICLIAVVALLALSFNIVTATTQKVWLDDKLNDITRIVAVEGDTTTVAVDRVIEEIETRMGGEITFECPDPSDWFDESEGEVQLNGIVNVNYFNDNYVVVRILNIDIPITIDLTKIAISERYYKPSA